MASRGICVLSTFLALTVLGLSGKALVSAQGCTKATCPPGPVIADFQYSNCTGEVAYSAVGVELGCENGTFSSMEVFMTESFIELRSWVNHAHCGYDGVPGTYEAQRYYLGVCGDIASRRRDISGPFGKMGALSSSAHMSVSTMVLLNVNASYESPQEQFPMSDAYPLYQETALVSGCYSPDNCTYGDGPGPIMWSTSHTNDTCLEGSDSIMLANISAAECYVNINDGYYMRVSCIDEHTFSQDFFVGDGCERLLFSAIRSRQCGNGQTNVLHCTALPGSPPDTPISQAHPMLTTMGIIVSIIATLVASFLFL